MVLIAEQFIEDRFGGFVDASKKLHAFFVSDTPIEGYAASGSLSESGLSIKVQCGYDDVDDAFANLHFSQQVREANIRLAKRSATSGAKILLVIYAGIRGLDEAIDYARHWRQQLPHSTIAILTCNCHLDSKERLMGPLVKDRIINHVLSASSCGGRHSMGEMVDSLRQQWNPQAA